MQDIQPIDFDLPESYIAISPIDQRDNSRLMVLNRTHNTISDHRFSDIAGYLSENDVLVLNDTKVMKARLFATRATGGKIEILLNQPVDASRWTALIRPSKRVTSGETLFIDDENRITVIEKTPAYTIVSLSTQLPIHEFLEAYGNTPYPPYIQSKLSDIASKTYESRYQTHYAKTVGAVAAPTAGLHFTPDLLQTLKKKGVQIETITLHIGLGTFQPLNTDDITTASLHHEEYIISPDTADRLTSAIHDRAKRVIAVGTTSVRALESAFQNQAIQSGHNRTQLLIYPGYQYQCIDGLITNFHLPKSSLLALVQAFAGTQFVANAYAHAIAHQYRFYSFGDAMLIE